MPLLEGAREDWDALASDGGSPPSATGCASPEVVASPAAGALELEGAAEV